MAVLWVRVEPAMPWRWAAVAASCRARSPSHPTEASSSSPIAPHCQRRSGASSMAGLGLGSVVRKLTIMDKAIVTAVAPKANAIPRSHLPMPVYSLSAASQFTYGGSSGLSAKLKETWFLGSRDLTTPELPPLRLANPPGAVVMAPPPQGFACLGGVIGGLQGVAHARAASIVQYSPNLAG